MTRASWHPPPRYRPAASATPGSRSPWSGSAATTSAAASTLDGTAAVLEAALGAGITFFDTADIYGGAGASERLMGEALEGRRDEFVLATKFGMEMEGADACPTCRRGSREYIRWAVEGSLQRLRVDRIDLYQYHRARRDDADRRDPGGAGRAGRRRPGERDRLLQLQRRRTRGGGAGRRGEQGLARFVTLQNEYSLLQRGIEAEVAPACERLGVSILPFFPLASGLLSGKYRRGARGADGQPPGRRRSGRQRRAVRPVEALEGYAEARGIGLLDVAIAGLAAQPAVASVIAGATRARAGAPPTSPP